MKIDSKHRRLTHVTKFYIYEHNLSPVWRNDLKKIYNTPFLNTYFNDYPQYTRYNPLFTVFKLKKVRRDEY